MKRTIYISGLMSGKAGFNFDAFNHWAKVWRSRGFNVINPAVHPLREYREMLAYDLELIRKDATDIFLMNGWDSAGAVGTLAEFGLATILDLTIRLECDEVDQWKST